MSKSVLYAANSNAQTTSETCSIINFGSIVRRYGCGLKLSGGNVIIEDSGYYDIDTNFTVTPSSAGTLIIQLFQDGNAIPGAKVTLSATVNTVAVSIPAIVREKCCCESTITAMIIGVPTTVNNASILVEKL